MKSWTDPLFHSNTVAEAEYRYQHREVTLLPGEIDGTSVAGGTIVISGDDPASWTDMDTMAHGKFFRGLEEDVLFLYPDCPYTAPEGYIFSGWKHAESGSVDGSGKLTGQTVFTLTAQWEPRYTVTKATLPAYAEWGTFTTELMEGDSFRPVVKIDGDAWQIGIRLTAVVVSGSDGHEIATLTQDAYGRDLNTVTATPGSDGMVEISLARPLSFIPAYAVVSY